MLLTNSINLCVCVCVCVCVCASSIQSPPAACADAWLMAWDSNQVDWDPIDVNKTGEELTKDWPQTAWAETLRK